MPTRDNIVRVRFVDEERRQQKIQAGESETGTPLLGRDIDFFELRQDWRELAKVLFAKGDTWQDEKEVRLLVDLEGTRPSGEEDENGYPVRVIDVPAEAIEEVYVGTNTLEPAIKRIYEVVGVGEGQWRLMHTTAHAYRMQVTSTGISNRRPPKDATTDGARGLDVAREAEGRPTSTKAQT